MLSVDSAHSSRPACIRWAIEWVGKSQIRQSTVGIPRQIALHGFRGGSDVEIVLRQPSGVAVVAEGVIVTGTERGLGQRADRLCRAAVRVRDSGHGVGSS